jgi:ABC-type transporter Mla MlaB component
VEEAEMPAIDAETVGGALTLRVHGELTRESVHDLERSWRLQRHSCQSVRLDLCDATTIDECGKVLVGKMFAEGVELVVRSRHAH